jgi:hypothetical protein
MSVTVSLPLFGSPGQEIEPGAALQGRHLRTLATQLHDRLHKAADLLDRLRDGGWSTHLGENDILLHHPAVRTQEDALRELQAQGIDPQDVLIFEDVEEDDES